MAAISAHGAYAAGGGVGACSALRRKDWAAAAEHYEAALRINPLNPDAWFALGYAYLKLPGRQHDALRVSQLEGGQMGWPGGCLRRACT